MNHDDYLARSRELRHIKDVLPLVYSQEPLSTPGERFRYSNSGMILLGAIIEKITGMEYKDYLRQQILDPLGMKDSGIFYAEDLVPNRATGYNNIYTSGYTVETLREMPAFSDGGLYTTVLDLLKFDQALLGETLLTAEYKEVMYTPIGPSRQYAYGWFVTPYGGTTVIYHGGGLPGFNAEFRRYPEMGYTIIVLSNYYEGAFELTNTIEAAILGLPYELASDFTSNYRRGMYYQQSDPERALEYFDKNLSGPDHHLRSLYQSARTKLLSEFDQEAAVRQLDEYISRAGESANPSLAAAWWRKGIAYEQLNERNRAKDCYEESLRLDPEFELARESLNQLGESR
jgi:CubicO group peptidase (beta-lactamase class C family)